MNLTAAHIAPIVALIAGTIVELRRRYLPHCGRGCRTERHLPFLEVTATISDLSTGSGVKTFARLY